MFDRILIANRGEIAARVIDTARRMGVSTVAVHSDADAGARHVVLADEAVRIGPPPAAESYLDMAAILDAARATGAQAIHPGYGFLSENPDFVEAVEAAGLTFIGPSAQAIRAMGLKDAAKKLMEAAGVPVVPGYHGDDQGDAHLAAEAQRIGYPVLIKAVAGGGGKGMRRVDGPDAFADALRAARAEARAAFGNADVLVEKFVLNPRHIEVQVFGDGTRAVHLFERDCSLQRRHQKVIEEAPAPGMTAEMRAAMGAAAVRAAEAIGYAGAGTVEFIVDGARMAPDGFWFMEMNTRLQVEHPVTEAITGVDLVEWQLRVAAGEPLPAAQDDLAIRGHAFEARIYAEDATRGFLPAIGRLSHVDFPDWARIDTGIRQGDAITPHYDPMIAKLTVHAETRASALAALGRALDATLIAGSTTNLGFLSRLARQPDFVAGRPDTGLIDRELPALTSVAAPPPEVIAVAALAAAGLPRPGATGFALWAPLVHTVRLLAPEPLAVRIAQPAPGGFEVDTGDERVNLSDIAIDGLDWRITSGGRTLRLRCAIADDRVTVKADGADHVFALPDPLAQAGGAAGSGDSIIAPMPGQVREARVAQGDAVAEGQVLLVLEAMKMEHALRAPRAGRVAVLAVAAGDQVSDGAVLLTLEAEDG